MSIVCDQQKLVWCGHYMQPCCKLTAMEIAALDCVACTDAPGILLVMSSRPLVQQMQ